MYRGHIQLFQIDKNVLKKQTVVKGENVHKMGKAVKIVTLSTKKITMTYR